MKALTIEDPFENIVETSKKTILLLLMMEKILQTKISPICRDKTILKDIVATHQKMQLTMEDSI